MWKPTLFLASILVFIVVFNNIKYRVMFLVNFQIGTRNDEWAGNILFNDYLRKFNKSYDGAEFHLRYHNFKKNLLKIEKLNRASSHATYSLTKFSDWSEKELSSILLPNLGKCEAISKQCSTSYRKSSKLRRIYNNKARSDCCKKGKPHITFYSATNRTYWWKNTLGDEKCICSRRSGLVRIKTNKNPILVPSKIDWREKQAVGPVMDQKLCSGCWAFSIIGVMESRAFLQNYSFSRLSVQELLDCSFSKEKDRSGCHNAAHKGRAVVDALNYLCNEQMKITTEAKYPLTLVDGTCHRKSAGVRGIKRFVNSCDMYKNESKLLEVLAVGPVVAEVNAHYLFNYNEGIIMENCETTEAQLNHAVQLVGYDTTGDTPYYILKNSWGTSWGEEGYARLAIGGNQCGVAYTIGYFDVN